MREQEQQQRFGPDVSRRGFLRGSGAAVAATAVAGQLQEAAAAAPQVAAAAPQPVTLNVNGKDHKLTLEPRVTLLDALRNDLNYTGCKEVCTTVNCGACTVLIDGKPVLACSRFAIAEQGKKITTVEGLNAGGTPDKVVNCFVKHDATQCGYCTPGFVVAVRGFCDMHPNATLEDVKKGLGGNLCRCGTYVGVIEAALECAKR